MILKCEILRKKFTFKTEKVGQETVVKFTHLFCQAGNANTMNRKEIYRTYFGWNVISQHYAPLPCHKISYFNVPMLSIKNKITRNGISPTHCFSRISSHRAAVCISMEASVVSFAVLLHMSLTCTLAVSHSSQPRKESAHAYSVYYGVRCPKFSISSRIENTRYLKIYWHDPAKTFPIYEWNLPQYGNEVLCCLVSIRHCVIQKQTACFRRVVFKNMFISQVLLHQIS